MKISQIIGVGVLLAILPACTLPDHAQNQTASGTPPLLASAPAEKDGLVVVIRPIKDTFKNNEPLEFLVTYHNASKTALRLPGNPAGYFEWLLQVVEVKSGKTYTGGWHVPNDGGVMVS